MFSVEMKEEAKGWNKETNVSFHFGLLYVRQSSIRVFWEGRLQVLPESHASLSFVLVWFHS